MKRANQKQRVLQKEWHMQRPRGRGTWHMLEAEMRPGWLELRERRREPGQRRLDRQAA